MLLFGEDLVDIIAAQATVFYDDFREHVFGLAECQPQRRLQQPLATSVLEFDFHLLELAYVLDDFVEQRRQVLARGQRKIQDGDFLLQLNRDFEDR